VVESCTIMTTVSPKDAEPLVTPRAGADLRAARERLGLSIADLAGRTRIPRPHLQALEEGRVDALPGAAYVLAYARNYASSVGLDADEMVRRFTTETAALDREPDLVFPAPVPQRSLPSGALVVLGLILTVGAYAGWYRLSGEGRLPAEVVTAVPERLASLAEQALPRQAASVPDTGTPVAQANPLPPDPALPVISHSPTSAAAAQVTASPAEDSFAPLDRPRILLRVNADSWLLVKDRGGVVLLNRLLKSGDTWAVPARSDLLLTTGNAGGTEIVVDGAITPTLGAIGAVRRDLPLDPDQIRDGKLATASGASVATQRLRQ
jgi:cytoskeleton protein RodZ